ncbi:PadR family transcriptional regulator [Luethyella okanaganae]|uniref:PadR family transcriptional regulator n=1 Tax=Luethyella okanaganae TaxID=69372 RepID=A0ABW1VK94_9MICO
MSVKHALLALLSRRPSTTYQLRKDFDLTTSQTWPLNIGQVSTTLQRLQRDGLVVRDGGDTSDPASAEPWHLTSRGRDEVEQWWRSPVSREHRGRDELIIKLALAVVVPGVDVVALVQRQRSAMQRLLHDVTRARRAVEPGELPARLVLDNHIFAAEAELRWLDSVEESVARAGALTVTTATHDREPVDEPARNSR